MNVDDEIKKAFTRHEDDVQTRPGAWHEVEERIGRSHRRRFVAAGIGSVIAVTGVALAIPRIGDRARPVPLASQPTSAPAPRTPTTPKVVGKIAARVDHLAAVAGPLWGVVSPPGRDGARVAGKDPA